MPSLVLMTKIKNPKPKSRRFTDQIEEWMIGQPSDQDDAAKKKATRIRKGKAARQSHEHYREH